jgi:uncharacterized protein YhaN
MMGISIDGMKVTRGSLDRFKMDFSGITIIYGENQSGKTSIYETLEACIVRPKDRKKMNHRGGDFPAGLSYALLNINGNKKKLTLSNRDSIYDYAESDVPETILSVRPFMVRGSHAGFTSDGHGMDVEMLKEILVRREALAPIKDKITPAAKDDGVEISDGILIGDKRYKEVDKSNNILKGIHKCGFLLNELDAAMSGGNIRSKYRELEALKKERDRLDKAQCYYAYYLQNQIKELQKQKNRYDEEKLREVSEHLSTIAYLSKDTSNEDLVKKLEQLEHLLVWIQKAKKRIDELEKEIDHKNDSTPEQLTYALVTLVAGTLAAILIDIAAISALGAGAAAFFVWRGMHAHSTYAPVRLHKQDIDEVYRQAQEEHAIKAASTVDLSTEQSIVERKITEINTQIKSKQQEEQNRINLETEIKNFFLSNGLKYPNTLDEARTIIGSIKKELQYINEEIKTLQGRLEGMAIDEKDYITEDPGTSPDYSRLREVREEILSLNEEIKELEKPKKDAWEKIQGFLKLESPTTWEELVPEIQKKRDELIRGYKYWIAKYVAKRACHEVLTEQDASINTMLNEVLSSEVFSNKLKQFTGNYVSMIITDEGNVGLQTTDGDTHLLDQVSSGAREQAILAIRLGLSERFFGEESLFLMLDDAFIFSDDAHAREIIKTLVELHVRDGWQIIYMTKDDEQMRMMEQICDEEDVEPTTIVLPNMN